MMFDFYHFKHLDKESSLLHQVTGKIEDMPYCFSLAMHTGETSKQILKNRYLLQTMFKQKTSLHFVVANQTHSDNIHIVSNKDNDKGWRQKEDAIKDCDALITDEKNIMLTILTADCVPLLMYDKKNDVIAAVHAGWKGSKAQIAKKTIQKMQEVYGSNAKEILVGIAPAIGACCYEVGHEVAKHFFTYSKAVEKKKEKYMINLPLVNQQQLLEMGIPIENIELSNICTSCEIDRFFSYRKEKGCTGRFMSMICII